MSERQVLYSTKTRRPILVVIGEHGAASVEIEENTQTGQKWGIISFHSRSKRHGSEPSPCPILGTCYPLCPSFTGGFDVADWWSKGQEYMAFAILEDWYHSQLDGFYID